MTTTHDSTTNVGLIGLGGMGSFHAITLAQLPNVRLVALADPGPDVAATAAAAVAAHSSFAPAVLTDSDHPLALASASEIEGERIDAIVIASPDGTHADLAIAAMQAGHRVLCEKPLATSIADAQRVVDTEVALGSRRLQLGFMREYDVPHRQVAEAVAGMGEIHFLRCVHRNTPSPERDDATIIGQSVVHDLHTLRFLTGSEVASVTTHASRTAGGALRHVVLLAEMTSGAAGVIEFDDAGFAYEVTVDVTAEGGTVSTSPPTRAVIRTDGAVRSNIGADWFGWFADAYRIQDAAWIDSITKAAAVGPSAWDGLVAQTVVEAALTSLESGRREPVVVRDRPSLY